METPCPSDTDLGGGCNRRPWYRSHQRWKGRRDLVPGGVFASAHDERRGMTLGLQIGAPLLHVGECMSLGREQAHAVCPDPYGPQCARRRRLSLLVVWPRDNIAQATNLATFLRALMVASCLTQFKRTAEHNVAMCAHGLGPLVGFRCDAAVWPIGDGGNMP